MNAAILPHEGGDIKRYQLKARANSIGGGAVEFTRIGDWTVNLTGHAHEVVVEVESGTKAPEHGSQD